MQDSKGTISASDCRTPPAVSILPQSQENDGFPGPSHPGGIPAESEGKRALLKVLQSTGGRALFVLINAATGILTARSLHPVGRGELAAMGVWPNILANLLTLGLPRA